MLAELDLDGPLFPGEQCWRCDARDADTRLGLCAPCAAVPFSAPSRTVEEPEVPVVTGPVARPPAAATWPLFPAVTTPPAPTVWRGLVEAAWLMAAAFDAFATALRRWAR